MGVAPPRESVARKIARLNQLQHTKGPHAGEPFRFRPWQQQILRKLFKINPKTGLRQYRMCLLMLPRKNGKTELAAALALDGLLFDHERGAEVYSAAADRDQASLCFNVAAQMVRQDAELSAMCEIIDSQKRIVHRASGSFYRAISAESYSKHGFNASRIIYDELHAAPTRELWDVLTTSTGARTQPLVIAISTAGYDRHSILWELYQHAKQVAAQPDLDPAFLPVIYEAPEGADWTDEKVWKACNPALGDFRSLEEMRISCKRAQAIPAQENVWRRLYLNQWTETDVRWLSLEHWDACRQPIDWDAFTGRPCYVGLDLSTTGDLTAAVAVFPEEDGPGCTVLPQFFVPGDRIQTRVTRDRVPYDEWSRRGLITVCRGPQIDNDDVRAHLLAWRERFDVRLLAYDPYNARDLIQRLEQIDGFVCVSVRQGKASLSSPSKALESAVVTHALRHDGHPVLRWNVANASVDIDHDGNIQPSKAKSTERIDGLYALIMGLDAMHRHTSRPPAYQMIVFGAP